MILENLSQHIAIYPCSRLISWRGLLLQNSTDAFKLSSSYIDDWINEADDVKVHWYSSCSGGMMLINKRLNGGGVCGMKVPVNGVGLAGVRTLQRFWRRRVVCQKKLAFMMCTHKRLGAASPLTVLSDDLLLMCTMYVG
jgi:hypothetical protein